MKITGGMIGQAGWILADLINMFRNEEQQAQYARNKKVTGKIASAGMAIAGAANPEFTKGKPDEKAKTSQHAGEGTHGVQPPSNPSNIHGAATTTGNQGAAHKARLEGLKANQEAFKRASPIKNQHPAPTGNGQKPMSNQEAEINRAAALKMGFSDIRERDKYKLSIGFSGLS